MTQRTNHRTEPPEKANHAFFDGILSAAARDFTVGDWDGGL
jgi:hypothetical protein